ncbi:DgyrCDS10602 [Dimorphilus gyrociliatus]|uniref:IST1 homolog n=1 Tax=Dimorphilus gyrociliatus TaxID=2664684 RepID=A0A7I8W393_9ANNE|nr:DgyrCDS10602 [Dimorphilus gyrociliatus]
MFRAGLDVQKLKTNLRLCINRLKMLEKKKTELAVKARREIADYLQAGKDDRAKIRVEHIIREDYLVEAMEIIEMYCDLLLARMGLIDSQKHIDEGLEEPIATIIWVSPRLEAEVPELKMVVNQFSKKYGKEWVMASRANEFQKTNPKVEHKLSVKAPDPNLVDRYLIEIAKTYNIHYEPSPGLPDIEVMKAEDLLIDFNDKKNPRGGGNDGNPSGGAGGGSGGGGGGGGGQTYPFAYPATPQQPYGAASQPPPLPVVPPMGGAPVAHGGMPMGMPPMGPGVDNPPAPSYEEATKPSQSQPTAPKADDALNLPELPRVPSNDLISGGKAGTQSNDGDDVDFDDLTRRFADLKNKK